MFLCKYIQGFKSKYIYIIAYGNNKVMELSHNIIESKRTRSNKYIINTNIDSIKRISIDNKQNKLHVTIYIKPLENKNITNDDNFIDVLGINKEFKYVFDNIKRSTNLSKKEVSNFVRNEVELKTNNSEELSYIIFNLDKERIVIK